MPAVLAAFSASLPGQKLPFGIAPDQRGGARLRRHHRRHRRGSNRRPRRVQTVMSSSWIAVIAVLIAAFGVAYVIGRLLTLRAGLLQGDRRMRRRRHQRPRPVGDRADRRALQRGVVRTVRGGAPGRRPGVRRPARRRARGDRHGRQSGCGAAAFGAVAADDLHLRRRRPATVPRPPVCPTAADLRSALRTAVGLITSSLGKLSAVSARLELVLTKRRAVDLCRVAGCCCCCCSC